MYIKRPRALGVAFTAVAALGLSACSSGTGGVTTDTSVTQTVDGEATVVEFGPGPENENPPVTTDLRDARYCEMIPVTREGTTLTAWVYNTLGFNDCPDDLWQAITEDEVKEAYNALEANLNGPRHWVLDEIGAQQGGVTTSKETWFFGGIQMALRAQVDTSLRQGSVGQMYTVNTVTRQTTWKYEAGQPVFELTDPQGSVYTMQSYSQIVDPDLSYDDLADLGSRLQLPEGWSYGTRILDEPLDVVADGTAYVVDDDLYNAYQRSVAGPGVS